VHPIEWLRAVARSGDVPQAELAGEAAAALAALADDPQGLLLACRRLLDRHPTAGALWWTCARLVSAADAASEARDVQRDLESDQVGLSLTLDLPDDACVAVPRWSALTSELAARRGDLRLLVVAPDEGGPGGGRRGGRDRSGRRGGRLHDRWAVGPDSAWDDDLEDDGDQDRVQVVAPSELGAAVADSDVVLVEAWAAGADRALVAPGALAAAAVGRQRATEVWLAVGVGRRLPQPLLGAVRRRVFGDGEAVLGAGADLLERSLVDRVVEPLEIPCPVPPELLRHLGAGGPTGS
jgi:hypothetical protein